MTINEALGWLSTMKDRHAELLNLRNQNSTTRKMWRGANADKEVEEKPVYDVKALDSQITRLARDMRLLDIAIKRTNAETEVKGYQQNEDVLGELG